MGLLILKIYCFRTYGCHREGIVREFGKNMYILLCLKWITSKDLGFSGGSVVKNPSTCSVGDLDSVPELEVPLEEDTVTHSTILAWRILKARGAWWAAVHGVTKSWTLLSD